VTLGKPDRAAGRDLKSATVVQTPRDLLHLPACTVASAPGRALMLDGGAGGQRGLRRFVHWALGPLWRDVGIIERGALVFLLALLVGSILLAILAIIVGR
jgi:hypothetical protein